MPVVETGRGNVSARRPVTLSLGCDLAAPLPLHEPAEYTGTELDAIVWQAKPGAGMVISSARSVDVSKVRAKRFCGRPRALLELAATLIKINRRQVLDGSRIGRAAIPQHIKAEVWAWDGGACRQCGMDGSGGASLEFDHIIPVLLGGATSVANHKYCAAGATRPRGRASRKPAGRPAAFTWPVTAAAVWRPCQPTSSCTTDRR
jgi:hypothetical protein